MATRIRAALLSDRAVSVIVVVILPVCAASHPGYPRCVGAIPFDRPGKTGLKIHDGLPAGFAHELFAGERIAPVVSWAVLYIVDEAFRPLSQRQHLPHH